MFLENENIFLIWKLITEEEPIFSDLKNYGNEIRFCSAKKYNIEQVLSEVNRYINFNK